MDGLVHMNLAIDDIGLCERYSLTPTKPVIAQE
jgi:hypothetical protein